MTPMEPLLHETVDLRTAYGDLVSHVCKTDADHDTVPLGDVIAGLNELGDHRAAALMYVHRNVDTIEEGQALIRELRKWLAAGRRPRTMRAVLASGPGGAELQARFDVTRVDAEPWWKRLWHRWVVADDAESERYDQAELRRRRDP